ncbi:MAG: response regulator [Deltaproteobacteria bacterium]|nr:MAG: response regulator [Deltaproteobacteria bacterium]
MLEEAQRPPSYLSSRSEDLGGTAGTSPNGYDVEGGHFMDEKREAQLTRIVERLRGIVEIEGATSPTPSGDRLDTIEHLIEALIRRLPQTPLSTAGELEARSLAFSSNTLPPPEGRGGEFSPRVVHGIASLMLERLRGEIAQLKAENERLRAEDHQRRLEIRKLKRERHELQKELHHLAASATVGTYTFEIIHEYNNFLASIAGYVETLRHESETRTVLEAIDVILQIVTRAQRIGRSLLGLSRNAPPIFEPVCITDLLDDALLLLQRSCAKAHISIERRYTCHPVVEGDPSLLFQLALNLLRNACDAMAPRGGKIMISVDREEERVVLRFTDTGPGIPPEIEGEIFTPFVTTKGKTDERGRHAGLGLAILQKIVLQHDGTLEVEETSEEGTTFVVRLPLLEVEREPDTLQEEPGKPKEEGSGKKKGLRILLVEDDPFLCQLLHRVMTKEGHDVVICGDGAAALGIIWQEPFDLILLDLVLPEVTGLEVVSILQRQRHRKPQLGKIAVMTGEVLEGAAEKSVVEKADFVLRKPFRLETLQEIIQQITPPSSHHPNRIGTL